MVLVCQKTGREYPGHASTKAAPAAARSLGLKDYAVQPKRKPAPIPPRHPATNIAE